MSIATWKKEFYGSLKEASKSDVKALKHGIKKWIGLLPENVKKHGVFIDAFDNLIEKHSMIDSFSIDSSSCALCMRYDDCEECPIFPCESNHRAPYRIWQRSHNPRPMIRVLKKALAERTKKKEEAS